ncbi:MAG: GNVR domain-containing protein [Candidatus Latescibacterota bacterium]
MSGNGGERRDRDVDVLDLLVALNEGKRLILWGTLAICVLAALLSFLLPNEYMAAVQLLPPKEERQGFGFSDLLSALPIPSLRLGEKGTPADIFIATLKSRGVRRQMVEDFDLMNRYGVELESDAMEVLGEKTTVETSEEGTIVLEVLDTDPQRAAAMANHYIALLDSTNKRISQGTAAERLRFIRHLLTQEDDKLETVMTDLQQFQAEHNAIAIEDQARAVIVTAAKMQTEAMELDMARKSLLASGLDEDHDKVKQLEQEFNIRQQALIFLRDGAEGEQIISDPASEPYRLELQENLFLPLRKIPKVAQEYAQLEKDVLVQKALMQLLLQQEAESLIESSNTTSTVQVLDPATPPELRARPRRFLIVFVAGVLSLFASISYVLGRIYVRALYERWQTGHVG